MPYLVSHAPLPRKVWRKCEPVSQESHGTHLVPGLRLQSNNSGDLRGDMS